MICKAFHLTSAATLIALAASAAHAAPVIFFGENQTPGEAVVGAPVTARAAFEAQLTGVGAESFEGLSGSAPLTISFTGSAGGITADLTGDGEVRDTPGAGRFNTSPGGAKYWNVRGTFEIDFSAPISAFGFYGTDIGDFDGQVTVALTHAGGVTNLTINNTVGGANGSLLFWGFTDLTTAYTKITFGNTNVGSDSFGFDDMIVGDRGQISTVAEPASLALVGMSLLGLAGLRRRS